MSVIFALLLMFTTLTTVMGETPVTYAIDSIPEGYNLHVYDDCGVLERQPHVQMADCYIWTFNPSDTDADLKSRSAVFSYKQLNIVYDDLDPKLPYVLAITYANDHVYNRVQSLWADGVQIDPPYAIPKAKAVRRFFRLPESVTQDGRLHLEVKIRGEVNATASIVELWAPGKPAKALQMGPVSAVYGDMVGKVYDLAYDGVEGVDVKLCRPGSSEPFAGTKTGEDGSFTFKRSVFKNIQPKGDLEVVADLQGSEIRKLVPEADTAFEPVRYRPIASEVGGLKDAQVSLDGVWRINTSPEGDVRNRPLSEKGWENWNVPGQWLQQGFDVPQDKPVAVAKEFVVPKEWQGYRIFLRFDAIHAGARYWLNGKPLGYSENLFTPVEWEITNAVKVGEKNRLDLEMLVSTVSERLSYASGYAFHNLGGIDRSVRLYVLPCVGVKDLHISTDLDAEYKDADLKLKFTVDDPCGQAQKGLSLHLLLTGPDGKPVKHSTPKVDIDITSTTQTLDITAHVVNPLKWSAEKPHLYKLALELKQGEKLLERIERNSGFRKIEIKDRQMFVNGVKVKLAGACRHEIDPLTGRADTMRHAEPDVRMLKDANLNYIRGTHYPPCQELLDAADRIGMYVEVEAPFCWVAPTDELTELREVLTPTSAMIDYYHSHPSVVIWSIANESHLNRFFEISNEMVHDLDPTRPTTFNHPMSNEAREKVFDISNRHYPGMPYDVVLPDDPHPLILGEYWFPICHEQTDVMINPGLRELWGHGHAEPDSDWGRACAASFDDKSWLHPGTPPGTWTHIIDSKQLVGGAMFASHDEPFYFSNGKHCGYAWVHGFWGLIDAWRRPKPEYWLAKLIFSPVWFPQRRVDLKPGQKSIKLPVENRYSFTNLNELDITWEYGKKKGKVKADLAPWAKGEIELPVPEEVKAGDALLLRVTDKQSRLISVLKVHLGKKAENVLPAPKAGAPEWKDDGKKITVEGDGFGLIMDRTTGSFDTTDPRHKSTVAAFPTVHITRFDFGDLAGPNQPPYAVLPDVKTRVVESVTAKETPQGLEITVTERYDIFKGTITWLIDKSGTGKVSYDYTYTGEQMNAREIGIRMLLKPECDTLKWRRWSEWDVFPEDSISRTEGAAKAKRDSSIIADPEGVKPEWPWSQDQTELGTADFRSVKFCIYEASLTAKDGKGVRIHANADKHLRSCLVQNGVMAHILTECKLGQVVLKPGDHIKGESVVALSRAKDQ